MASLLEIVLGVVVLSLYSSELDGYWAAFTFVIIEITLETFRGLHLLVLACIGHDKEEEEQNAMASVLFFMIYIFEITVLVLAWSILWNNIYTMLMIFVVIGLRPFIVVLCILFVFYIAHKK
jgi:hypothetical protein